MPTASGRLGLPNLQGVYDASQPAVGGDPLFDLSTDVGAFGFNGGALAAGGLGLVGPDYFAVRRGVTNVANVAYNSVDDRATLYSGAAAGLEFAPDPSGGATTPTYGIRLNKFDLFPRTRTFSGTGPVAPIEWSGTFNMGFSSNNSMGGFIDISGTINFTAGANPFGMGNALRFAPTWKNQNGVANNLGPCFLFVNQSTFQADNASISMSQMRTFFDSPTYETINGGTFTMGAAIGHVGVYSSFVVNSGATVGLRRGHAYFDATGTGTLTEQIVLDIPNLTFAGTNTGIRSAMNTPGTFISHTGTAAARFGGEVEIDGALNHDGSTAGFFGSAPVAQQDVTGSRSGNAALASLLTALENLGIVTDSTTAL